MLFRVKDAVGDFAQRIDVEAGTLTGDRVRIIDSTRFPDGNPESSVSSNARLDGHGTIASPLSRLSMRCGPNATPVCREVVIVRCGKRQGLHHFAPKYSTTTWRPFGYRLVATYVVSCADAACVRLA